MAALAAGKQVRAWHFVETFYDEQGEENSGYVSDSFLHGIASQIEGLNLNRWASDRGNRGLMKGVARDGRAPENGSRQLAQMVRGPPGGPLLLSRCRVGHEREGCSSAILVVLDRGRPAQPDRADHFSVHLNGKSSSPRRHPRKRGHAG